MVLSNGYDVSGIPHTLEYSKNSNGRYTVKVTDYTVVGQDGRKFNATLLIPNAQGPFEGEEGIISLSSLSTDVKLLCDTEDSDNTLWRMIIPEDIKDTFDRENYNDHR